MGTTDVLKRNGVFPFFLSRLVKPSLSISSVATFTLVRRPNRKTIHPFDEYRLTVTFASMSSTLGKTSTLVRAFDRGRFHSVSFRLVFSLVIEANHTPPPEKLIRRPQRLNFAVLCERKIGNERGNGVSARCVWSINFEFNFLESRKRIQLFCEWGGNQISFCNLPNYQISFTFRFMKNRESVILFCVLDLFPLGWTICSPYRVVSRHPVHAPRSLFLRRSLRSLLGSGFILIRSADMRACRRRRA